MSNVGVETECLAQSLEQERQKCIWNRATFVVSVNNLELFWNEKRVVIKNHEFFENVDIDQCIPKTEHIHRV